jgi:hypothetical protein
MSESFVVQISCNFPAVIELLQKQSVYLNALYQNNEIPFYIEIINNGFILIMHNFETFKMFRNQELLDEKIARVQKKNAIKPQIDLILASTKRFSVKWNFISRRFKYSAN